MTEFQILSAVKNNGGSIDFSTLLSQNITDTYRDNSADQARIEKMIADKLLQGKADAYCLISITRKGLMQWQDASQAADEEREKQAKQEKQQRFDNKISVATALVPLITFILGIFVEFQANIVDWFLALFK